VEEPTPSTAAPSGLSREEVTVRYAVPAGAMDCGDGFYILTGEEPCGEVRYLSCSPHCAVGRYSNDLWQAQLYIEHMKGNLPK